MDFENDERKKIVDKIYSDFGVSIPLLSWSGMTKGELWREYRRLEDDREIERRYAALGD